MKTFDEILPEINTLLTHLSADLGKIDKLIINRDLNGYIRLIVDAMVEKNADAKAAVEKISDRLASSLETRIPAKSRIIYEDKPEDVLNNVPHFPLGQFPNVFIADRLLVENDWAHIVPPPAESHRMVFYSIKGGVGRSTALAVTAWALAEEGKKVMVLDMDIESPGLSSSLLPKEKSPAYGITDWLVEDLVDNGDAVFPYITAVSEISRQGEIRIVPAHGRDPGEYISKLGRVWMSKTMPDTAGEPWHQRLNRLLHKLENQWNPDVVLIDSRAGIDEIAAACVTCLGARDIFLFAVDSEQTWKGYQILFDHWNKHQMVKEIRSALQVAGALIPEIGSEQYIDSLRDSAWTLFTEKLYDSIPAGGIGDEGLFNFDLSAPDSPHNPLPIFWNRGFTALPNLYDSLSQTAITAQIRGFFGQFIDHIQGLV
jgi:Mrp family chromosome partitioning ATPase